MKFRELLIIKAGQNLQLSSGDIMGLCECKPAVIYIFFIMSEHRAVLQSYLLRFLGGLLIPDPLRLFLSAVFQQIYGAGYQDHYRENCSEIRKHFPDIKLYGTDSIMKYTGRIKDSMASWKLIRVISFLLRKRRPELLESPGRDPVGMTADIDVSTVCSSSSRKEGAEIGHNKSHRGRPCFQLSASFIGKVFADGKLFPGHRSPKDFFQKAVKRLISPGYGIKTVRADSAYLSLENLLFLQNLSLSYLIGAPATFSAVKKGRKIFKRLARQESAAVISAAKGVSLYDMGRVMLSDEVGTRLIVIRRISRKKNRKTGKWKIRTYYYATAADFTLSARKIYEFYHKRQCIEAGFRELKQHYHLERLPFRFLAADEFWIISKIMAAVLFKIFQAGCLPAAFRTLQRKTFLRPHTPAGPAG